MGKWQEERVRWKTAEALNLLIKSWNLKGKDLGVFLRGHGLKTYDISSWKSKIANALESDVPVVHSTKRCFQDKIEKLERQLEEANHIIDAQKKVQKILVDVEKSTEKKLGKESLASLKKKVKKG